MSHMNLAGAFLTRFLGDRAGSIVQMFALGAPVIAIISVGAVELSVVASHKATLQAAADAAALNAAGQIGVAKEGALDRAKAFAQHQLNGVDTLSKVDVSAEFVENGVKVSILGVRGSFFGNMLPPGGFKTQVSSTAVTMNGLPLCVLATKDVGQKVLSLKDSAQIGANGCLVHSNRDITAEQASKIFAGAAQASSTASGSINPAASVGAPRTDDPFASLPVSNSGPCIDNGKLKVERGATETVPAGVHCGDWEAGNGSILKLAPGEHWFRKAKMRVRDDAKLYGRDVVLILDKDSKLEFHDQATVDLEGRKSGALAGFLIITDRNHTNDLEIWSDGVDNLLGVIYAPAAKLHVDGKQAVGENSDWTVVVARQIELKGQAKLTINSNYSSTLVPVPQGVGPSSVGSKLIE